MSENKNKYIDNPEQSENHDSDSYYGNLGDCEYKDFWAEGPTIPPESNIDTDSDL